MATPSGTVRQTGQRSCHPRCICDACRPGGRAPLRLLRKDLGLSNILHDMSDHRNAAIRSWCSFSATGRVLTCRLAGWSWRSVTASPDEDVQSDSFVMNPAEHASPWFSRCGSRFVMDRSGLSSSRRPSAHRSAASLPIYMAAGPRAPGTGRGRVDDAQSVCRRRCGFSALRRLLPPVLPGKPKPDIIGAATADYAAQTGSTVAAHHLGGTFGMAYAAAAVIAAILPHTPLRETLQPAPVSQQPGACGLTGTETQGQHEGSRPLRGNWLTRLPLQPSPVLFPELGLE